MSENAKRFFEELDANEKAQELLKSAVLGDSAEDSSVLAQIARETGYEVADGEMGEFLAAMRMQRAAASDDVADQIRELDVEELDAVAGGVGHPACHDTYLDDENCLLTDFCAKVRDLYVPPGFTGTCDSYVFCAGFAFKPECDIGRLGF